MAASKRKISDKKSETNSLFSISQRSDLPKSCMQKILNRLWERLKEDLNLRPAA